MLLDVFEWLDGFGLRGVSAITDVSRTLDTHISNSDPRCNLEACKSEFFDCDQVHGFSPVLHTILHIIVF